MISSIHLKLTIHRHQTETWAWSKITDINLMRPAKYDYTLLLESDTVSLLYDTIFLPANSHISASSTSIHSPFHVIGTNKTFRVWSRPTKLFPDFLSGGPSLIVTISWLLCISKFIVTFVLKHIRNRTFAGMFSQVTLKMIQVRLSSFVA